MSKIKGLAAMAFSIRGLNKGGTPSPTDPA